jgi:ferric-dicitrate binding protein FerR (iron transport regulator)
MKPIDPSDISALLDGKLSPEDADRVRRALAEDSSLRREYEELAALDAELKASARAAMFLPEVVLPKRSKDIRLNVPLLVLILVVLRFGIKATPLFIGSVVEIVFLFILLGWGLQYLLKASEHDIQLW